MVGHSETKPGPSQSRRRETRGQHSGRGTLIQGWDRVMSSLVSAFQSLEWWQRVG